jgi:hypothetical protein
VSVARQRPADAVDRPDDADSVSDADGGDDAADEGVSPQTAFEVLSCARRRYVLHHLLAGDGRGSLREVTTRVAAWENGVAPDEVTSKQRMRVYTALRQSHLPKMDRAGVVAFDAASGEVELTDDADALEAYLGGPPGDDVPWSEYYLGLGAVGAALAAALWLEAFPFVAVPPETWLGAVSLALVASGLVHTLRTRRTAGPSGEPTA